MPIYEYRCEECEEGFEVEFHPITLDRFKGLLVDSLSRADVGGSLESQEYEGTKGD